MHAELAMNKIKTAIKQVLKKQNLTYGDVAKVWDCSLPTVKRQLGPEELPLSRLLTLLEWLNLELTDLQKLVESDSLEQPRYTARQNDFLARNPREFSFLMKLYEDHTPDQIARKYKLSAAIVEKILIQLEKYDLVRLGAGGRVKPSYQKVPAVDGALAQVHMRRVIDRVAYFHKARITEVLALRARGVEVPKGGLTWHVAELSEKTYLDFLTRAQKLMDEMNAASKIEEKTLKKSQLKVAVANIGFFLCEPTDPNLSYVTDVMDDGLRDPNSNI